LNVVVNLGVLAVSIVAIRIALESYDVAVISYNDAHISGIDQMKALRSQEQELASLLKTVDAARKALDQSVKLAQSSLDTSNQSRKEQAALLGRANGSLRNVVNNSEKQQQLTARSLGIAKQQFGLATQERDVLRQTLNTSKGELALANAQAATQRALRTNMPALTFWLSNPLGRANGNEPLQVDSTTASRALSLTIINNGVSNLHNAIILIGASPESVNVVGGNVVAPNVTQFNASVAIPNTRYPYQANFQITPGGVTKFDLTIHVAGENDGGVAVNVPVVVFHAIVLQAPPR